MLNLNTIKGYQKINSSRKIVSRVIFFRYLILTAVVEHMQKEIIFAYVQYSSSLVVFSNVGT